MSYYEWVAKKKELVVLMQVMIKNELEKYRKNEVEHLRERLVHERKYHEAEYMHVNLEENELLAKKR